MNTTTEQLEAGRVVSPAGADRRVPAWAAGLLAGLARDEPVVVTRADIEQRLGEAGSARAANRTVEELRRLGWLATLHLHGVWAFIPPGRAEIVDPYLGLRGWRAREPDVVLRMAGDAAAWQLGYLNRRPDLPVHVWLPKDTRIPDGLRRSVSAVRLHWPTADADKLDPRRELLRAKKLDMLTWSGGLPAFGPEALLAQLATRPSSFRSWMDFVEHLRGFAADIDLERTVEILGRQSSSAWQRAAYLMHCGHQEQLALSILDRRPPGEMPTVAFGTRSATTGRSVFSATFRVVDHLVVPLLRVVGKA